MKEDHTFPQRITYLTGKYGSPKPLYNDTSNTSMSLFVVSYHLCYINVGWSYYFITTLTSNIMLLLLFYLVVFMTVTIKCKKNADIRLTYTIVLAKILLPKKGKTKDDVNGTIQ